MTDREVLIIRDFAAPRELVFDAWSAEEHLLTWFAPRGCQISFRKFDFRVGGLFHSCIRIPDGSECWCQGEYRQIVKPERIEFTMVVSNAQMQALEPTEVGMDPAWPKETVVTVTLEERGHSTRLTLRQTVDEALAKKTGAYPSWLDQLEERIETL